MVFPLATEVSCQQCYADRCHYASIVAEIDTRWCGMSDHICGIDEIVGLLDKSEYNLVFRP